MMYTTRDGRVWKKIGESIAAQNVERLPILYVAHDILCETPIRVHEGHVHDASMPEKRVICSTAGSIYTITVADFEANFTPVQPEAPKTPSELRAARFGRA